MQSYTVVDKVVLKVELPTQRAILELVLAWNLKGAKMTVTRHVDIYIYIYLDTSIDDRASVD